MFLNSTKNLQQKCLSRDVILTFEREVEKGKRCVIETRKMGASLIPHNLSIKLPLWTVVEICYIIVEDDAQRLADHGLERGRPERGEKVFRVAVMPFLRKSTVARCGKHSMFKFVSYERGVKARAARHVAKLPLSEENDSRSELAVPYVKLSFKTPAKRPYSSSTPALRRSDVFNAVAQALVVNIVQRKPCKSRARLFVVT